MHGAVWSFSHLFLLDLPHLGQNTMPPSRSQSTIRSSRSSQLVASPVRYKIIFQDDEVFVRNRPPLPLQEEGLDGVFTDADGLQFGWRYRANYVGLERAEYSRALDSGMKPEDPRPPPLRLEDLECIRTLGEGASCKVVLARTVRDKQALDRPGTLIAMKTVSKKYMRDFDNVRLPSLRPAQELIPFFF
ncbi:hypothetical protein L218DRAFT_157369 [Marasmius fiardii PR-910]|nr:hypothetical protein L218DRAFT_157369 [Marasmius fiardii PR-910]